MIIPRLSPSLLLVVLAVCAGHAEEVSLENRHLKRTWSTAGGKVLTTAITNKAAGKSSVLNAVDEFRLRVSESTDVEGTDKHLTAADFTLKGMKRGKDGGDNIVFQLENELLAAELRVSLAPDENYLRKQLTLVARQPLTLEHVDVESLGLAGAEQPYTIKEITAAKPYGWKPGLGQPLYGRADATFWGIEFPAATNTVEKDKLRCGYPVGRKLEPGRPYVSYPSVMGAGDDPAFLQDAFFDYIERIRVRPFRLQFQYNCWFDFGGGVDKAKFAASVTAIDNELVKKRGVKPLDAYVIDDGWQDNKASWAEMVWPVTGKFDKDFGSSVELATGVKSKLGLWLSPCCAFGAQGKVAGLKADGYEALPPFMSLAGPKYMDALERRMEALTRQGVAFWKLDGIFGHLNTRVFELQGARYGLPEMPQLGARDFAASDPRLNDPKYDELKTYYLAAATERLMRNFSALAKANPEVYIVISNAAYLSPWWLQHVDASWIINSADGATGKGRTGVLVYRDAILHDITIKEKTQFPMNAMFNHEPKKTDSNESPEEFRNYLYMALSRGTGFMEFYLKPTALKPADWDVLAEGMIWAEATGANFKRARMHGGDPKSGEVYGFTGWLKETGYLSIHNPSEKPARYRVTLDRKLGLLPGSGQFHVGSPMAAGLRGIPATCKPGDTIDVELQPAEVRILNFSAKPMDFQRLRALQGASAP